MQQCLEKEIQKSRLLIVDGITQVRKTLLSYLQDLGFSNFVEVTSEEQAVDILREQHFDALITDFEVAGLNSERLLSRVKGEERTSKLPLLVIASDKGHLECPAENLADHFLSKPLSKEMLQEKLHVALGPK